MIAIDTEASYAKERDIKSLGVHGYVRHPETDHFMVSIYSAEENLSYVGPPEEAPWDKIRGKEVCCHNYSYDSQVLREYERRGIIKEPLHEKGVCTANMAAYLQVPRSLAGSSEVLLNSRLDKSVRDKFKGKNFHSMSVEAKVEIAEYALKDAANCYHLWDKYNHLWPANEREYAEHTTMMGDRGICLDYEQMEKAKKAFSEELWNLEKLIPWSSSDAILSIKKLQDACRSAGIPAPETTAKKDDTFMEWVRQYSGKAPFVEAVGRYRSVNRTLEVLKSMELRCHDGRMRYGLKYFGAVPTGRWSGDSGLNMQNLPRDGCLGFRLRELLVPAQGKVFISADMSQIEPRISLYITNDTKQLDLIRGGMCVYEAHARQTLGYDLKESLKFMAKRDEKYEQMRSFCKARVLGLTYGQFAKGFQAYAKTFGLDLTHEQASFQVTQFKKMNPKLVSFWRRIEADMRCAKLKEHRVANMTLPSGRTMFYHDVRVDRDTETQRTQLHAKPVRGENYEYYSFGKIHNNICQGTARDVLAEKVIQIEYELGLPVILTVHDEVLVEVDQADAEDAKVAIERIMATPPEWMPDIPLASECFITERYSK